MMESPSTIQRVCLLNCNNICAAQRLNAVRKPSPELFKIMQVAGTGWELKTVFDFVSNILKSEFQLTHMQSI